MLVELRFNCIVLLEVIVRVCVCVSVTIINRRGSCGVCPSFVTIIHEHTASGGGFQQSSN